MTRVSNGAPTCNNHCPPSHSGHWRDWHRGHGCHNDPSVVIPSRGLSRDQIHRMRDDERAAYGYPITLPPDEG